MSFNRGPSWRRMAIRRAGVQAEAQSERQKVGHGLTAQQISALVQFLIQSGGGKKK